MKRQGLAVLLLVGGCATEAPRRPAPIPLTPPRMITTFGLEGVLGRNARALEAQFGRPDLDVREGSARKLQFGSQACVLDAYLYPPQSGGEPIVTYLDARLPDGRDFDRASCVAALARRREAR